MKTVNLWRTMLAGAILAVVGSLGMAQPPASGKAPAPAAKAGNGETGDLRSFQLAYADPEEVRQIVSQMVPGMLAKPGTRPIPGAPGVPSTLRIAVDQRTRTLFARGTEKELDAVAEVVSLLDADPSKSAPEGKSSRIIRLRYAKVPEVQQVLTGLGLQNQVVYLPRTNAMLLVGTEGEKEIRAVLEKLDVEPRTTSKPPVKKPTPPVND